MPVSTLPDLDPEEDPLKVGERMMARRARGQAGTVLTSWRGVSSAAAPVRKRLLGE
ncbi:MAG TPA: hypothetical protein VEB64_04395 [Azospirillaceae bacterium]|nr:hypothetical protein [Azospirillaceae bacterium]